MPEEAYGQADPDAIFTVELAQLPGAEELEAGQQVYLHNAAGPVSYTHLDVYKRQILFSRLVTYSRGHSQESWQIKLPASVL